MLIAFLNPKIIIRLTLFILSILIFSLIYYFTCNPTKDFYYNIHITPNSKVIDSYLDYVYLSAQIQCTLGFGDISPKTKKTRFFFYLLGFFCCCAL